MCDFLNDGWMLSVTHAGRQNNLVIVGGWESQTEDIFGADEEN